MALNCLQIIQTVCDRIGILRPNAVVTSTDNQILQLLALSNQAGMALVKRYPWNVLQTESTFTTSAVQLQGTLSSLAPGYKYITNNTIWNRTKRLPVYGSKSAQDWQEAIAMSLNSPYSQYRIRGDSLYFYPVPAAGDTCAFEYASKNWVSVNAGGTNYLWQSDLDTPLLDEDLLIAGITWRWKQVKGLEYGEDFATYESDLVDAMNRDGTKPIIMSSGTQYDIAPAVIVPAGAWNV